MPKNGKTVKIDLADFVTHYTRDTFKIFRQKYIKEAK